jgi:hypothetical protein
MKLTINDVKIDISDMNEIFISSKDNKIIITISPVDECINEFNESEEIFSNGLSNAIEKFLIKNYIKTGNKHHLVDLSSLSLQFFVDNQGYSKYNDDDFKNAMNLLGFETIEKYDIIYFQGIIPKTPEKN